MHLYLTVVANEPELPKSVHEEAYAGTGGADHLRQGFLADLRDRGFGLAALAELSKEQKHPGEPLFAGVEKLVYQVFLNPLGSR